MEILTGIREKITKAMTQAEAEEIVTGKVLDHSQGRGYCFLMSLLYGVEELGGYPLLGMVHRLRKGDIPGEVFNPSDGFVGDGDRLVRVLTGGEKGVTRLLMTTNIDVARNLISASREEDLVFLMAKFPGHYVYVRRDGSYSNPSNNWDVDLGKVIGWRVWKLTN